MRLNYLYTEYKKCTQYNMQKLRSTIIKDKNKCIHVSHWTLELSGVLDLTMSQTFVKTLVKCILTKTTPAKKHYHNLSAYAERN